MNTWFIVCIRRFVCFLSVGAIITLAGFITAKCLAQNQRLPAIDGVLITTTNTSKNSSVPVYLSSVKRGRVGEPQHLVTFARPCRFFVSPSAQYVLSHVPTLIPNAKKLYILDRDHGNMNRFLDNVDGNDMFLGWSPQGDNALYFSYNAYNETPINAKPPPNYLIINAPTATFARLIPHKNEQFLSAYWSRDNRHIIYSSIIQVSIFEPPAYVIPHPESPSFWYVETKVANNRLVLGTPRPISPNAVDNLVGTALRPMLQLLGRYYQIGGSVISLSQDGKEAFCFGDDVRKGVPDWAPQNRVITYAVVGKQTYRQAIPWVEGNTRVSWTRDGKWVQFLNGVNKPDWVLYDPFHGDIIRKSLGATSGVAVQILPPTSTTLKSAVP